MKSSKNQDNVSSNTEDITAVFLARVPVKIGQLAYLKHYSHHLSLLLQRQLLVRQITESCA